MARPRSASLGEKKEGKEKKKDHNVSEPSAPSSSVAPTFFSDPFASVPAALLDLIHPYLGEYAPILGKEGIKEELEWTDDSKKWVDKSKAEIKVEVSKEKSKKAEQVSEEKIETKTREEGQTVEIEFRLRDDGFLEYINPDLPPDLSPPEFDLVEMIGAHNRQTTLKKTKLKHEPKLIDPEAELNNFRLPLTLVSEKKGEELQAETLIKAKENKTPILLKKLDGKFSVYGCREGIWQFTELKQEPVLNIFKYMSSLTMLERDALMHEPGGINNINNKIKEELDTLNSLPFQEETTQLTRPLLKIIKKGHNPQVSLSQELLDQHWPDLWRIIASRGHARYDMLEVCKLAASSESVYQQVKGILTEHFVQLITWGRQEEAENMLLADTKTGAPRLGRLLTEKCAAKGEKNKRLIKDYSNRTLIEARSGLQYALWAGDTRMWQMLKKHLLTLPNGKELLKEELEQLLREGLVYELTLPNGQTEIRREAHYDFNPLIAALQEFINHSKEGKEKLVNYLRETKEEDIDFDRARNESNINREKDNELLIKVVGGEQTLVPVHVVNELCREDKAEDLSNIDKKNEPPSGENDLPRTMKIKIDGEESSSQIDWYPLSPGKHQVGVDFAVYKGPFCPARCTYDSNMEVWACIPQDIETLTSIRQACTKDINDLKNELGITSETAPKPSR